MAQVGHGAFLTWDGHLAGAGRGAVDSDVDPGRQPGNGRLDWPFPSASVPRPCRRCSSRDLCTLMYRAADWLMTSPGPAMQCWCCVSLAWATPALRSASSPRSWSKRDTASSGWTSAVTGSGAHHGPPAAALPLGMTY